MNSCRWRTKLEMISRNLAFGARANSASTAVVTCCWFSMIIAHSTCARLLVRLATEKTRDLPVARVFDVAQLLASDRQHRLDRDEADFPVRQHHLDESSKHRIRRGVVGQHAYEIGTELV